MSINSRLNKLEQLYAIKTKKSVRKILLVGFEPKNNEPIGYSCNGIEVFRQPNESKDALLDRLGDLLECPDKPTLYAVSSIYSAE
ncbi:MAG TPA: hypothetical protein VIF37_12950 [Methylobacter sp.]|jgi:hypothetical protein